MSVKRQSVSSSSSILGSLSLGGCLLSMAWLSACATVPPPVDPVLLEIAQGSETRPALPLELRRAMTKTETRLLIVRASHGPSSGAGGQAMEVELAVDLERGTLVDATTATGNAGAWQWRKQGQLVPVKTTFLGYQDNGHFLLLRHRLSNELGQRLDVHEEISIIEGGWLRRNFRFVGQADASELLLGLSWQDQEQTQGIYSEVALESADTPETKTAQRQGFAVFDLNQIQSARTLVHRLPIAEAGQIQSFAYGEQANKDVNDSVAAVETLQKPTVMQPGARLRLYQAERGMGKIPELREGQWPNYAKIIQQLNLGEDAFAVIKDRFVTKVDGYLKVSQAGEYEFRLTCDDGGRFELGKQIVVDHDGLHGPTAKIGKTQLVAGMLPFQISHFEEVGGEKLVLEWKPPGKSAFEAIPGDLIMSPSAVDLTTEGGFKSLKPEPGRDKPGDRSSLVATHPALQALPELPGVLMADVQVVTPDGQDWWIVSGQENAKLLYLKAGTPAGVQPFVVAQGLDHPSGFVRLDGRNYVLQQRELTELIDHNADGKSDGQRVLAAGWSGQTGALQANPGGQSFRARITSQEAKESGAMQILAIERPGFADPNADLSQVLGKYESRYVNAPSRLLRELADRQPIQLKSEAGISSAYADQFLFAEENGEWMRAQIEKVDGVVQGSLFRFSGPPLSACVRPAALAPGAEIAVLPCASTNYEGKELWRRYRLANTQAQVFEVQSMASRKNGLQLTFSQPLDTRSGNTESDYQLSLFEDRYDWTSDRPIEIYSVKVSEDRRRVFLELPNMREGASFHLRLLPPIRSANDQSLWSTEAWTFVDRLPQQLGDVSSAPAEEAKDAGESLVHNQLTKEERKAGWKLLFDGKGLKSWRGFRDKQVPGGWQVQDGTLAFDPNAVLPGNPEKPTDPAKVRGDIMTQQRYESFELKLEWQVQPGGNSGIFYRVEPKGIFPWLTGPEMQVLDNERHGNGLDAKTSAGANYALHAPKYEVARPGGYWNQVRIVVDGNHVEHWLNGFKVVEYELLSEEWEKLVAASKFSKMPEYGRKSSGHIVLQDHGDKVWYRNIKIRKLPKKSKTQSKRAAKK